MAETFYVKQGAEAPHLEITLKYQGAAILLDGSCVVRVKSPFYSAIDFNAVVLDQNISQNRGKIRILSPGINPNTNQPLPLGDYDLETRYTTSTGDLYIFPTEASPYDNPIYDKLVVQKSL